MGGDSLNEQNLYKQPKLVLCLAIAFFVWGGCNPSERNDIETSALQKADSIAFKIEQQEGPEKSFKYLDSCYGALPRQNLYDAFIIYSYKRNYYFSRAKDYSTALLYADSQLANIQKIALKKDTDKSILSTTFVNKGLVLFHLKRYHEAYDCYFKSKEALAGIKDSCIQKNNEAILYGFFANIKYKQQEYITAANYFQKSFHVNINCPFGEITTYEKQGMLDNIALSYAHAGLKDSALHYYQKALEWIDYYQQQYPKNTNNAIIAKAVVYGNLATLYCKENKLDSAEALLKKSIEINKKGEQMDAQVTQIKLINLYIDEGRTAEAHKLLQETRQWLDTLKNENGSLKWLLAKQQYFDKLNQADSAYETLKQYYSIRDSIADKDKYLTETDILKELKNKDQQHQIDLLKKSNQFSRIYLFVAIALSLMAVIIAYLIWRNMKQARIKNAIVALANNQLEASNKNYGRIMKVMAHDFKTPLAGMTAVLTLLNKKEKYSEEGKKLMELLLKSCKDSLVMIDDLLHTAFEKRPEHLKKETININQLLEQCVALMQFKANEKKQHIVLQTKDNITIAVNHEKIWRLLLNLLRNASKFSAEGKTITVASRKEGSNLLIIVKDDGMGIPQAIQIKIFDMFTDAVRPGTNGEKPVGIGLSICKQIVELHDGKIWVESEEDKGATFYVQLPIQQSPTI